MKQSILFVDDEQSILKGLQRSLRGQRKEWDMVFVDSAEAALKIVNKKNFDAIVSDMRMPGMDGAQLLQILAADHPELVRIILSGHSDEEMIMQSIGTAHQFLTKPCDTNVLKDTLNRTLALRGLLDNERLHSFVTGISSLPSIPQTYQKIMDTLHSADASLQEVGEIISTDPAMTAKILQLVNSAFFGLGRQISNSKEATTLIGLDAIKALALSIGIFSQFDKQQNGDTVFSIDTLLNHALAVARLAERIAQAEGADKTVTDNCFLAGMLHETGILILEDNFSEDYDKVRELSKSQDISLCQAEQKIFGATHAAVGAYLLGLWSINNTVVEAVAFHHQPELSGCTGFSPLVALHAADILMECEFIDNTKTDAYENLIAFLKEIGLEERLETWKSLCSEGDQ